MKPYLAPGPAGLGDSLPTLMDSFSGVFLVFLPIPRTPGTASIVPQYEQRTRLPLTELGTDKIFLHFKLGHINVTAMTSSLLEIISSLP